MAKFDWTKASVIYPDPARVRRSSIKCRHPKEIERNKRRAERRKAETAEARKRELNAIGRKKRKMAAKEAAEIKRNEARYKAYLVEREIRKKEKAEYEEHLARVRIRLMELQVARQSWPEDDA